MAAPPNPHARHSYVPAAPKLKASFTARDSLPVLRKTGSLTPSSRRGSCIPTIFHSHACTAPLLQASQCVHASSVRN